MASEAKADFESSDFKDARRFLLLTQAFFFCSLTLCILINHSSTAANDGISFYGVYDRTILIVVVGYTVAAIGMWRTSSYYASAGAPPMMVWSVRAIALGLFVVLATPYNQGTLMNWSHMSVGVIMALVQGALTIALVQRSRTLGSISAASMQAFGGVMAAASLPDWHFRYLLFGETVYQVGFSVSLVSWIYALSHERSERERRGELAV